MSDTNERYYMYQRYCVYCFILSMSSALVHKVMLWSNLIMIKIVILHPQGYDLMYKWNNRETLGGNKKIYI